MIDVILLNKLLNDVLIPENCKLLLKRWLFLLCNSKFNNGGMNILHHLVLIEGKSNMNAWAIDELIQGFFI
jgi:hypothetical protein